MGWIAYRFIYFEGRIYLVGWFIFKGTTKCSVFWFYVLKNESGQVVNVSQQHNYESVRRWAHISLFALWSRYEQPHLRRRRPL